LLFEIGANDMKKYHCFFADRVSDESSKIGGVRPSGHLFVSALLQK